MTKKQTFIDILAEQLAALPDASRLAIALDPRRLLDVKSPLLDDNGRDWQIFIYDRNDLDLRRAVPPYQQDNKRLLLIAIGSKKDVASEFVVDLSYVPDLVEEATGIIDCSPPGLLAQLIKEPLPADLFEEPLLSLWAHDISGFVHNIARYQKIAGKGTVMNRFDAMAVSLTTSASSIGIDQLAAIPSDPISRITLYLRIVAERSLDDTELSVLQTLILASDSDKQMQTWRTIERPALLRFLYFGLAAISYAVPNGVEDLQRLGLLEFDARTLGDTADKALSILRRDIEFVQAVTKSVEESPALLDDADKLVSMFKFGSFSDALQSFAGETSPAIACGVGRLVVNWLVPSNEGRNALGNWRERDSLTRDNYPKTSFTLKARRYRELVEHLSWLEFMITNAPEPPGDLLSLVDIYRTSYLHLLELKEAGVFELTRLLNDRSIMNVLKPYLEQLRMRIRSIITAYDKKLAGFVSSDFSDYANCRRLNTQILRNLIQAGTPRRERVWIIILDGMRLDSWDCTIWPRLSEYFELDGQEQAYLATLPSETDISRVAFLAGGIPHYWKDYYNNFTADHNILFSRHLRLGKEESRRKIKILARVEEKVEQIELDFETAQFRCLIFNISDSWIHNEQGSLVRINEIVKEKFEKTVLPELTSRIDANDVVVVTSDHGFIELRKESANKITDIEGEAAGSVENIKYRNIQNGHHTKGIEINYGKDMRWSLAVGSEWFERPKAAGRTPRYSHGGISMAEMVIPAVRLKKRVEQKVELLLTVDAPPECSPGDVAMLSVRLQNRGTVGTEVELSCRLAGRLMAEDSVVLPAGAPYTWPVTVKADPRANQVTISARYTLPTRAKKTEKRSVVIPIKELGARVEIDTSALDVFEDI